MTEPNTNPQQPEVTPEGQEPTGTTPPEQPANPEQQAPTPEVEPNDQEQGKRDTFDRKYVEELRNEAAANRTKAKEHEAAVAAAQAEKDDLINKIGKAFGFVKDEDDQQADASALVEQVTAERDTLQQELRSLRQENALSKALNSVQIDGQPVQVDPTLTLAVIKGNGSLNDLDPGSDDYASQVEQIVSETVKAHPQLRAQVAPRSSGTAPTPTDNTDGKKLTADDLNRLSQEGKWDEINKAAAEGRIA